MDNNNNENTKFNTNNFFNEEELVNESDNQTNSVIKEYQPIEEEIEMLRVAKLESFKMVMRRSFFALLIYVFTSNILAGFINQSIDYGLSLIFGLGIPLYFVSKMLPYIKFKQLFSYNIKKNKFTDLFYFFGMGLVLNFIVSTIVTYILKIFGISSESVTLIIQHNISPSLLIYVVLIGPVIEEVLYRGHLAQNLARFSRNGAIILVSLVFAFSHLNIEQSFSVLGLAFLVTYIGLNYSFKMALAVHVLNNLNSIFVLSLVEKFGEQNPLVTTYSFTIVIIMILSTLRFIRKGRFDLKNNLESTEEEKIYTKKILSSIYFFLIIAFYLVMMYLVYITPKVI